jgi:guanosine-3',5'-bis(diphosphate) 3'-pyrophosphohydrolase
MTDIKTKLLQRASDILSGPMTLDKAILVAVISHAGQEDKGGNSYIRHPLRVMEGMDSEDEMVAGVCHDVVEDTAVNLTDLLELGFTSMQRKSIDALTKRTGETYDESIDRVLKDVVARKVKTKDIRDNSQMWRLKSKKLTMKDMARQQNYIDALVKLGEIDKK